MANYTNFFTTLHHIDIKNKIVDSKKVQEGDLENYISELIKNVLTKPDERLFCVQSDTTEVVSLIRQVVNEGAEPEEVTQKIADRLHRIEIKTQERYGSIADLQKGSLIQAYVSIENIYMYLIAKVEHNSFLDEEDFVKRIGLPYEKHILKTCLVKLTEEKDFADIVVYDTRPNVSAYWWNDFLELRKMNSDEHNTDKAFKAIDQHLSSYVKKYSPRDFYNLRNHLIGYFKTQAHFKFETMIDSVFGVYEPEKPELVNMTKLKAAVSELPVKRKFDRSFTIAPDRVKAHMKKTYKVNNVIDISINEQVTDDNLVTALEGLNGDRYLKIKTDNEELFKMFKKE